MQVCVGIVLAAAAAVAATAVIPPAVELSAAVGGEAHRGGGLDDVGGGGALSAGTAQNLRLVGVHSGHQDGVLVGLRCGQSKRLVLALESADFVLAQIVQNSPCPGVLTVDDVPRVVVHCVLEGAGIGGHIIVHAINGPLCLAAAILLIVAHLVKLLHQRGLLVTAGKLGLRKSLHDVHPKAVNTVLSCVEAITQSAVDAVQLIDNGRGVEAALHLTGNAATPTAEQTAVAEAVATSEHGQDDDCKDHLAPGAIAAPSAVVCRHDADVLVIVGLTGEETHSEIRISHYKKSPFHIFAGQGRTLPGVCTLGAVLDHGPQTEKEKTVNPGV